MQAVVNLQLTLISRISMDVTVVYSVFKNI